MFSFYIHFLFFVLDPDIRLKYCESMILFKKVITCISIMSLCEFCFKCNMIVLAVSRCFVHPRSSLSPVPEHSVQQQQREHQHTTAHLLHTTVRQVRCLYPSYVLVYNLLTWCSYKRIINSSWCDSVCGFVCFLPAVWRCMSRGTWQSGRDSVRAACRAAAPSHSRLTSTAALCFK